MDSLIMDYTDDTSLTTPEVTDTGYDIYADPYEAPGTDSDTGFTDTDPTAYDSSDSWSAYDYQQQVYDEAMDDWSDQVLGYEDVYSPSEDQVFEAPYDSYDEYGPDGPGYYMEDSSGYTEYLE